MTGALTCRSARPLSRFRSLSSRPSRPPPIIAQTETIPTFAEPAHFESVNIPHGIAAGDVGTADGLPDIAIACGTTQFNGGGAWTGAQGKVEIWKNSGDWSPASDGLTLQQTIFIQHDDASPAEVAFAFMDDDEFMDLVITAAAGDDTVETGWGVYVYRWDSDPLDPKFVFHDYEQTPHPVRGLAIADFNNDGFNDVVAATDLWAERLPGLDPYDTAVVCINDSTPGNRGKLLTPVQYEMLATGANTPAQDVVAVDFKRSSGTPKIDFVTANIDTNDVSVAANQGHPTYNIVNHLGCNTDPHPGDWNFSDIASGRFVSGSLTYDLAGMPVSGGYVAVLRGNGTGGIAKTCKMCSEENADFYCINPPGFTPPLNYIGAGIAIGHLNGGTKLDIIATTSAPTDRIAMLLGKGNAKFQFDNANTSYYLNLDIPSSESYLPFQLLIADMNQDGKGDILSSNSEAGSLSVFLNTGSY